MKLKKVLEDLQRGAQGTPYKVVSIAYRTRLSERKIDDIFIGLAKYDRKNEKLVSLDGDDYSLDDELVDWDITYYDPIKEVIEISVYVEVE